MYFCIEILNVKNVLKLTVYSDWLFHFTIVILFIYFLLKACVKEKISRIKLLLIALVFIELNFSTAYRKQIYLSDLMFIPKIRTLKITSDTYMNNMLYNSQKAEDKNIQADKYSFISPLANKNFYYPISDEYSFNPYYNFKTNLASQFIKSNFFKDYTQVINKKFILLNTYDCPPLIYSDTHVYKFIKYYSDNAKIIENNSNFFYFTSALTDDFEIVTNSQNTSTMLFNQIYDKNWTLYINNKPTQLHLANKYFMSFDLPKGKNKLKLFYKNNYLKYSIIFNYIVTFILLFFLFYYNFFKKKYAHAIIIKNNKEI